MDFKSLSSKAKALVDKRGGSDSLKEDAEDLKSIAKGEGSLSDKAKAAVEAIKDPGASPEAVDDVDQPTEAADPPAPAPAAAADAPDAVDDSPERGGRGRGGQGRGGGGRRGGRGQGGRRRDQPNP